MRGNFPGITSLEEDLKDLGILSTEEAGDLSERRIQKHLVRKGRSIKIARVKKHLSAKQRLAKRKYRKSAGGKSAVRKRSRGSKARKAMRLAKQVSRWHAKREGLKTIRTAAMSFLGEARKFMDSAHPKDMTEAVKGFFRPRLSFGHSGEISAMLEDLSRLTSGLGAVESQDVIKSFANLALVAEMLSERFEMLAEALEQVAMDEEMGAIAQVLDQLAEDAAQIAKGLHESAKDDTLDYAAISEAFRSQMSVLLNGLEIYATLTEDDSSDEGDDDEDEDDEEDDEADEEDKDKEDEEGEE